MNRDINSLFRESAFYNLKSPYDLENLSDQERDKLEDLSEAIVIEMQGKADEAMARLKQKNAEDRKNGEIERFARATREIEEAHAQVNKQSPDRFGQGIGIGMVAGAILTSIFFSYVNPLQREEASEPTLITQSNSSPTLEAPEH